MDGVRPPAVAGVFYPADPVALLTEVHRLLEAVPVPADEAMPRALVVPHAGLRYSGPIAASGYARLAPLRGSVRMVVLIGPAHHGTFCALALSGASAFASPLGELRVDREAVARVLALPGTCLDERAHAPEHCLEVQLPFIQATLGEPAVVPILADVGADAAVAAALDALWTSPDTLVVISSDLSHYLGHEQARTRDRTTAAAIEALNADALAERAACGCAPVRALLRVARARGLTARTLDLRSSGDTAGDKRRVVGYGAFAVS